MDLRLLIIDPQNDFCDPQGALYVPGADQDMERVGVMIKRLKQHISNIHVTLDMHHYIDIAHPIFWINREGKAPEPLTTIITADDVEQGRWRPFNPDLLEKARNYVTTLKANNRYSLVIWPYHCLIGSWGSGVHPVLFEALLDWEKEFRLVDYITKGGNIMTEHYSAVQADVPDPQDPETMLNTQLIRSLEQADCIAIAGEALNFCVANTVRDIAHNFGEDSIKKLVLLKDASSPVPGSAFEPYTNSFLDEMTNRGMQISTTVDFMR